MSREEAVPRSKPASRSRRRPPETVDLFGTGDMGIGNTTPSSAIVAAFSGRPAAEVTGRGTGIDDEQFARKVRVIDAALQMNRPDSEGRPRRALAKVGGFEIGGIAGLILGRRRAEEAGRRRRLHLHGRGAHRPRALPDGRRVHDRRPPERGAGPPHRACDLGKQPLIDLDLRLGEGTGAALAMNFVEAAVRVLTEVATFDEAMVSKADQ